VQNVSGWYVIGKGKKEGREGGREGGRKGGRKGGREGGMIHDEIQTHTST